MGCNVGLKVMKKRWINDLGYVQLRAMKTMKQPLIDQHENEHYKLSNPNKKQSLQWIGNKLTTPIIHSHFFLLVFRFLFFVPIFYETFLYFFFLSSFFS